MVHLKGVESNTKHRRSASAVDLHFSKSNLRLCRPRNLTSVFDSSSYLYLVPLRSLSTTEYVPSSFVFSSLHDTIFPPPIIFESIFYSSHSNLIAFCLPVLKYDFIYFLYSIVHSAFRDEPISLPSRTIFDSTSLGQKETASEMASY